MQALGLHPLHLVCRQTVKATRFPYTVVEYLKEDLLPMTYRARCLSPQHSTRTGYAAARHNGRVCFLFNKPGSSELPYDSYHEEYMECMIS